MELLLFVLTSMHPSEECRRKLDGKPISIVWGFRVRSSNNLHHIDIDSKRTRSSNEGIIRTLYEETLSNANVVRVSHDGRLGYKATATIIPM
jgi:hypothetical protein